MINFTKIPMAYSEVYSFINVLGNNYINKIPNSIYNAIEKNRDKSYNPKYTAVQNISSETISKEGLSLIAALNLQYWCEDEAQKQELKETYANNARKEEKKYNNIFKKDYTKVNETSTEIIEYKESFFRRLLKKIKEIFKNVK